MSPAAIIRFPLRRTAAVWITQEDGAWLVLAGSHGWLHGDYYAALADAQWLAVKKKARLWAGLVRVC
jgi:hypothetical protein